MSIVIRENNFFNKIFVKLTLQAKKKLFCKLISRNILPKRKFTLIMHYTCTEWKSAIKSDHDFCAKINIFTKEVTKELTSRKFFERDRVF